MITAAAYQREESRGSHFRSDFPQKSTFAERSTLTLDAARTIASRDYAFDFDAECHGKEKATDQLTA